MPAIRVGEKVEIIFHCIWSRGALYIDQKLGKPLCTNSRSWRAKAEVVSPELLKVDSGGYCSDCGYIGQALIPDKYMGATVEVHG